MVRGEVKVINLEDSSEVCSGVTLSGLPVSSVMKK